LTELALLHNIKTCPFAWGETTKENLSPTHGIQQHKITEAPSLKLVWKHATKQGSPFLTHLTAAQEDSTIITTRNPLFGTHMTQQYEITAWQRREFSLPPFVAHRLNLFCKPSMTSTQTQQKLVQMDR
jgi:hypothetical protein